MRRKDLRFNISDFREKTEEGIADLRFQRENRRKDRIFEI